MSKRVIGAVVLGLFLSLLAQGANKVEVVYKEAFETVVGVRNTKPIILINGKKKVLDRLAMRLNRLQGTPFDGGYIEVKDEQVWSDEKFRGNEEGHNVTPDLEFSARIKTSMDMRDGFMTLDLKPEIGNSGLLLLDLPNFKADKWEEVNFTIPISQGLGNFTYKAYYFNNGLELLTRSALEQLQTAVDEDPNMRQNLSSPPGIKTYYRPRFPEALIGVIDRGTVRVEFTIDEAGIAQDAKILSTDHELLNQAALDVVNYTVYKPAIALGKPVSKRIQQNIEIVAAKDLKKKK